MEFTPKLLKRMLNLYPPYLGAGVKVTYISEERDEEDELVARVKKTIYVRKKSMFQRIELIDVRTYRYS